MATKYPSLFGARQKSRGSVLTKAIKRQPLKPPRAPKASYGRYAKGKPLLGADTVGESTAAPSARDVQLPQTSFTGGSGGYDVNSDPAVARIGALSQRMRAEAQASALAKKKQATLEYGDPTGVEGIDEATAKAARENPFSILSAMKRSYDTGLGDLEEGLNKGNLFYSGYRGQQLGEAGTAYQQGRYDAGNRYRATIQDINDALAGTLLNADMMDADAIGASDGGYYDPGGYEEPYIEGPPYDLTGDRRELPAQTKPKPKPKPRKQTAAQKRLARASQKKSAGSVVKAIAAGGAKQRPKPRPRPKRRSGV